MGDTSMDYTPDSANHQELRVNFYPELFLQRRIWVLNILRKESITKVLDVGCGEGELLGVLCQPSPWLTPPPPSILSPSTSTSTSPVQPSPVPPSPTYNDDDIPNLHISELHGLDISPADLAFALKATAPIPLDVPDELDMGAAAGSPVFRSYTGGMQRWEALRATVWKGGLEVINEAFVNIECIVGMEVIEHLPPAIFPAFAPALLGVYHPKFLLITTPSYTFNARWTAPDAPQTARSGYLDPTGRTDRVFRHSDHKFEWTRQEFSAWCKETAEEWGYEVEETSIGRALNADPWGREDELEGASSVAVFRRLETMPNGTGEEKGRALIQSLALPSPHHEALAIYDHRAHPSSMKPHSLDEIATCVKAKMEYYREAFMRVEELWFEKEISILCGGWIELLVRAVEQSPDLDLKKDCDIGMNRRENWSVELIGGVANVSQLFPAEGNTSVDCIPPGWMPGEGPWESEDESDFDGSTTGPEGADGDVSAQTSDAEADDESDMDNGKIAWGKRPDWSSRLNKKESSSDDPSWAAVGDGNWSDSVSVWGDGQRNAWSSTAGWDGDESEDTTS